MSEFETIAYSADGGIATITLNRPEALNTIVPPMTDELEAAVGLAVRDPAVKVIVLRGAGRSFCGGFDFGGGFHHWDERLARRRRVGPGARAGDDRVARAGVGAEVQRALDVDQAGDRDGPRLVRGWWVRAGVDRRTSC